jgi:hypothetical protein
MMELCISGVLSSCQHVLLVLNILFNFYMLTSCFIARLTPKLLTITNKYTDFWLSVGSGPIIYLYWKGIIYNLQSLIKLPI